MSPVAVGDQIIGNQTGYGTIDQYRYPLAETMNCSKSKNVFFTQECHHFINVRKIDGLVDFICASLSGFSCDKIW